GATYTCKATIGYVFDTNWYYTSCSNKNCNKKVVDRVCPECHLETRNRNERYMLRMDVEDSSGVTQFVAFDREAKYLIEKPVKELVAGGGSVVVLAGGSGVVIVCWLVFVCVVVMCGGRSCSGADADLSAAANADVLCDDADLVVLLFLCCFAALAQMPIFRLLCCLDDKLLMDRLGIMATYRQSTPTSCIWTKPDGDTVKLNSDASVTDDHAGTGGTIRDCNGDILLAYSGSGGNGSLVLLGSSRCH
ncbi:hypothetical protein IFM89_028354, partial [Coptis chinensis]